MADDPPVDGMPQAGGAAAQREEAGPAPVTLVELDVDPWADHLGATAVSGERGDLIGSDVLVGAVVEGRRMDPIGSIGLGEQLRFPRPGAQVQGDQFIERGWGGGCDGAEAEYRH